MIQSIALANRAYDAVKRQDMTTADAIIEEIYRLGRDALSAAMTSWVDRATHTMGVTPGSVIQFEMEADETGDVYAIDQCTPEVAWAGRMWAARVARDRDMWWDLINSLPDDETQIQHHAFALLTTMATTESAAVEDRGASTYRTFDEWLSLNPNVAASRRAVYLMN